MRQNAPMRKIRKIKTHKKIKNGGAVACPCNKIIPGCVKTHDCRGHRSIKKPPRKIENNFTILADNIGLLLNKTKKKKSTPPPMSAVMGEDNKPILPHMYCYLCSKNNKFPIEGYRCENENCLRFYMAHPKCKKKNDKKKKKPFYVKKCCKQNTQKVAVRYKDSFTAQPGIVGYK